MFLKNILSFSCLRTALKKLQTNSIFCIAQHSMMIVNLRYYQSRRDHQNQVLGIWTTHHAFDPAVCLREEGEYWTSWWFPVVYEAPHGTSGSLSCAFLRDIRLTCSIRRWCYAFMIYSNLYALYDKGRRFSEIISPRKKTERINVWLSKYEESLSDFLVYSCVLSDCDGGRFIDKSWAATKFLD